MPWQTLYFFLLAIQIATLTYWSNSTHVKTNASIPNAAVKIAGTLAIALLSYVEHQRTVRPSLIIEAWLLVTILFDLARARTLWLSEDNATATSALATAWTVLKVVLLGVEALSKRELLRPECKVDSPEEVSGLISKMVFWWLVPLFRTGYKKSFTIDDLPPLDKHLKSEWLFDSMRTTPKAMKERGSHALLFQYFGKLKWHLLAIVPPRLGLIAFNFTQPFLIQRAIDFSSESAEESPKYIGIGLIGAYFLVYTGIAVTNGQYQHLTYRAIFMARGGLVSSMFAKTSTLKANNVDTASSLTLMSADIERILNGWQTMNEIWANLIEIGLAIWLLERQLGVACVVPLGVAIGQVSPIPLSYVLRANGCQQRPSSAPYLS